MTRRCGRGPAQAQPCCGGSVRTSLSRWHAVLNRVAVALARESSRRLVELVEDALTRVQDGDRFTALFRSPVADYSVLIHLDVRVLPRAYQAVDWVPPEVQGSLPHAPLTAAQVARKRKYKNLELASEAAPRRHGKIGFDPAALLLGQLTVHFGDVAHWRRLGAAGRLSISMRQPDAQQALAPHPFKLGFAQHSHPVPAPAGAVAVAQGKKKAKFADEGVFIALDVPAVLAGIRALGTGIVAGVEEQADLC